MASRSVAISSHRMGPPQRVQVSSVPAGLYALSRGWHMLAVAAAIQFLSALAMLDATFRATQVSPDDLVNSIPDRLSTLGFWWPSLREAIHLRQLHRADSRSPFASAGVFGVALVVLMGIGAIPAWLTSFKEALSNALPQRDPPPEAPAARPAKDPSRPKPEDPLSSEPGWSKDPGKFAEAKRTPAPIRVSPPIEKDSGATPNSRLDAGRNTTLIDDGTDIVHDWGP